MREPVQVSYLAWMYQALGIFYALVLPLTGMLLFIGACLVVAMNRRPAVIAAYLVFLPLPLLIGLFGSIQGAISAYSVIAVSSASPDPAEIAAGISTALFSTLVGFIVSFPAYFVTAIGLFFRAVTSPDK